MMSPPQVPTIVAVTGLRREARLVSRPGVVAVSAGGDARALTQGIDTAIGIGARRILSIGICGGLLASLKIGDCIVATGIVAGDESLPVDREWSTALLTSLPQAQPGLLAGTDTILSDAGAKANLQRATGAVAADMESHIAARIAQQRALPFAAVRIVSDTAEESLPPAVLVAMAKDGGVDVPAVLRSVMREPGQIPALIRTAFDAERAFRALARCSHVLAL